MISEDLKLILTIKNQKELILQLKEGSRVLDHESLTVSQNIDNMLITSIDKLLGRNRIDSLSLKDMQIVGKMRPEAVSSMIINTIRSAVRT